MKNLKGKRLLVLAGADVHVKVVRAAKELGVYTIVTDYLSPELAPAKVIADEYWMISITDVDAIVERCRQEHVDGVLTFCIDPAQKPYQQICERLGVPCYGTKEQFSILSDKRLFKDYCSHNGVGTIPEYSLDDIKNGNNNYPVLVKPTISRGSRGQTVCYSYEEVKRAAVVASNVSQDGGCLIERFMNGAKDMAFAYMIVQGEPFLLKIGDRYLGTIIDGLERQQMATVIPSRYTQSFLAQSDIRIKNMIKKMGIDFGAVFFQGFYEDGQEYMYDPGLRFPGSDYDIVMKKATGFDPMKAFVYYALTGDTSICFGDISTAYNYGGGHCLILSLSARAGRIAVLEGVEEIGKHPFVCSAYARHKVGDYIENRGDVSQRVAEFCALIPKGESIEAFVDWVYRTVQVKDEIGADMIISRVHIKDSDYNKEKL